MIELEPTDRQIEAAHQVIRALGIRPESVAHDGESSGSASRRKKVCHENRDTIRRALRAALNA